MSFVNPNEAPMPGDSIRDLEVTEKRSPQRGHLIRVTKTRSRLQEPGGFLEIDIFSLLTFLA